MSRKPGCTITPEALVMLESGRSQSMSATNQRALLAVLGISQAAFWGPVPTRPRAPKPKAA
jgi:hypothetical protein